MGPPRLQVTLLDPADVADAERFRPLLSPDEAARLDRMRHPRRRHEYLLGRALIRTLLSRAAAAAEPGASEVPGPAEWRFVLGEKGRPELAPGLTDLDLRFNLAHTFGLIACVVATGLEVGLDVEDTWRRGRTTEIAGRFFAPAEVAELRSLPSEAQRARFFDYWCLKESYIKARGLGLAIPLRSFAFDVTGSGPIGITMTEAAGDVPAGWRFELASPTTRHRLAVAWRRPGADAGTAHVPEMEWLDPGTLASGQG